MIPMLVDGPAIEPVTLADAKTWLRLDGPAEDDLVRALIVAARLMVEAEIGQVLIGQNWRLIGDRWPSENAVTVKVGRVLGVTGGRTFAASGASTPIPAASFEVYRDPEPSRIVPLERPMPGRALSGIEIDMRLGFGEAAADVPETIRLAIRRLILLWYDERGDSAGPEAGLPPQIRALLKPWRRVRL
ncbi:MAG: phage head-tail connector protein [Proteobacteria bacterium]|nr:phage head-tail connector protein [Pseudomonadota bacterium]